MQASFSNICITPPVVRQGFELRGGEDVIIERFGLRSYDPRRGIMMSLNVTHYFRAGVYVIEFNGRYD